MKVSRRGKKYLNSLRALCLVMIVLWRIHHFCLSPRPPCRYSIPRDVAEVLRSDWSTPDFHQGYRRSVSCGRGFFEDISKRETQNISTIAKSAYFTEALKTAGRGYIDLSEPSENLQEVDFGLRSFPSSRILCRKTNYNSSRVNTYLSTLLPYSGPQAEAVSEWVQHYITLGVKPNNILVTVHYDACLLYTSPSPRDATLSRMPSSA